MLFFYDDDLKNNNNYLNNEINRVLEYLNAKLDDQNANHDILLKCLDNLVKPTDNTPKSKSFEYTSILFNTLDKIRASLKASDSNIKDLKSLKRKVNAIKKHLGETSFIDDLNSAYENVKEKIKSNNDLIYNFFDYYLINCNFNIKISTPEEKADITTDDEESKSNDEKAKNDDKSKKEEHSDLTELHDNNILLVSEKNNLVYLPYKISELETTLDKNKDKYTNLQDIIDKDYTIPLDRFKNPIVSRFKETLSLMRDKEKASISKSLDLALELAFNSLLNPAIICACKNLKELDIYLDYLETNELDKFNIFEVKYEVAPQVII